MNKLITTVLKSVGSVKITLQQLNHPTGKYLNKIIELLETIMLGVDTIKIIKIQYTQLGRKQLRCYNGESHEPMSVYITL